MFKKMLVLALLIPGAGGCIIAEEGGHGGHHGGHRSVVVARPVHAHCVGCRHIFRGGVWVISN